MPAYPQLGEAKAGELGDWVRNTQGGGGGEQTFQYNRERERESNKHNWEAAIANRVKPSGDHFEATQLTSTEITA